jgi:hypothetical protein
MGRGVGYPFLLLAVIHDVEFNPSGSSKKSCILMLLAANVCDMVFQTGNDIIQPEKWLSISVHPFSEINSLSFLRIFMHCASFLKTQPL